MTIIRGSDGFDSAISIAVTAVDENYDNSAYEIGANGTSILYSNGDIIGSTDNGEYTMFANGSLTITFNGTKTCPYLRTNMFGSGAGNMYGSDSSERYFPVIFTTIPGITTSETNYELGGASSSTDGYGVTNIYSPATDSVKIIVAHYKENQIIGYYVTAIGRWK